MLTLPTFTVDLRVTPETGREDKIELALGKWIVQGDTETLDTVREFIGAPPTHIKAGLPAGELGGYGWIFNREETQGVRRKPLKIRTRDLKKGDGELLARAPLFSGSWHFTFSDSGSDDSRSIPTELQLSLNPLRYVRHNPGPRPLPAVTAHNWPEPRLLPREGHPDERGEFSLDGEDNWLPDTAYHAAWANPHRLQRHLAAYVYAVRDAFDAELERVTTTHHAHFSFQEDFRFKTVETAWEFAATEPIELVRSLVPHLIAYNDLAAHTTHYRAAIEGRIVNSPSITITLGANVALRLYAKTNRRIRFEIIQTGINHRDLLGEPVTTHAHRPPRPWQRIFDGLTALRVRAANELNAVLEYLSHHTRTVPSQKSGFCLLIEIVSVVGNPSLAHTIVSILLGGSIRARDAGAELLAACQRLASVGILAYDLTRRVYDVTDAYAHALAMLRTVPEGRIVLRARRRTRSAQN